jgi:hypothetical protein
MDHTTYTSSVYTQPEQFKSKPKPQRPVDQVISLTNVMKTAHGTKSYNHNRVFNTTSCLIGDTELWLSINNHPEQETA